MPSAVWPLGRVQLELLVADRARPGTGSACGAERQRAGPLDVVLLVELAQLALRRAGLAVQALRGRLADAQRRLREREAAEQVVPVAVRGEQPGDGEARLLGDGGQDLELVGQDRRVDAERLVARADDRAGRLPEARRRDEDVGVDPDDLHRVRRRRAAWPPRGGS